MGTKIIGIGHYVPERVVTNNDLAKVMETTDEWIQARSGIKERRYGSDDQSTSDLAYEATQAALKSAEVGKDSIECIILATLSPDHMFPGSAVFLQEKLGLAGVPAMDVRTQCSGFLYSLSVAKAYIESGMYKRVLVVGAEVHSKGLDFSNEGRDVAVLFGDGAGAVILEQSDSTDDGILDISLGADGKYAKDLWVPAPGTAFKKWFEPGMAEERLLFPQMNGRKVFQMATTMMEKLARDTLLKHNLTEQDIDLVICHQANARIIEFVRKSLEWDQSKFFINIDRYGNTTAASIPIALSEALLQEKVKPGSKVLLLAFGSGFTWGSALISL